MSGQAQQRLTIPHHLLQLSTVLIVASLPAAATLFRFHLKKIRQSII
jgi:hypothetical protein